MKIDPRGPRAIEEKLRENLSAFLLWVGDILRQDRYEETKKILREKVQGAGYLDADFSVHLIRLSLAEKTAHIE